MVNSEKLNRIVFVGVNNKAGLKPLCSTTKTGRLIDRIIDKCNLESIKTNLFDYDKLPDKKDLPILSFRWMDRIELMEGDIIVLLGAIVHKYFPPLPDGYNVIEVAHPASKRSNLSMNNYVNTIVEKILKLNNEQRSNYTQTDAEN